MKKLLGFFLISSLLLTNVGCQKQEDNQKPNIQDDVNQNLDDFDTTNKQNNQQNEDESNQTNDTGDKLQSTGEENKEENEEEISDSSTNKSELTSTHTHSWTSTKIEATCTSEGYTLKECACGEIKKNDVVAIKDHEWGEFVVIKQPTSKEKGEERAQCEHCGKEVIRDISELPLSKEEKIQIVFELVNKERIAAGVSPLRLCSEYQSLADTRALELKQNFSHVRPDGREFWTVFEDANAMNFKMLGENVAMGYTYPEDVMEGWMDSPGHKENILTSEYTGIIISTYDGYWVQLFVQE